jgi:hypothetical protein
VSTAGVSIPTIIFDKTAEENTRMGVKVVGLLAGSVVYGRWQPVPNF